MPRVMEPAMVLEIRSPAVHRRAREQSCRVLRSIRVCGQRQQERSEELQGRRRSRWRRFFKEGFPAASNSGHHFKLFFQTFYVTPQQTMGLVVFCSISCISQVSAMRGFQSRMPAKDMTKSMLGKASESLALLATSLFLASRLSYVQSHNRRGLWGRCQNMCCCRPHPWRVRRNDCKLGYERERY